MNWLIVLLTVPLALLAWTLNGLIENFKSARRIGFPIVISPVSTLNPFWILTYRAAPAVLRLRCLPFGLGTWARCMYMGWQFDDKHALHDEFGPVFTIVTPAGNEVIVADPQTAHHVLAKRKAFIKPAVMYDQLNVFGRNVNTVEGDDWQRQRRLTAPNFNEKTSAAVWAETLRQAESMSYVWIEQGAKGTKDVVPDTATLALHVLTKVGFGESYPFHGGVRNLPTDHKLTYADALSICLRNIITFSILSKSALSKRWMPRGLQRVGLAAKEFQLYMEELLAREKARQGKDQNLMSALVNAAEDPQDENVEMNRGQMLRLSDDEIYGNIFAFNLAGHETTANTVAAAIVLLTAYPRYQKWLHEEITSVIADTNENIRDAHIYETHFPRLQRCLAVMYETLRLYGSIVFIPKTTGVEAQEMTTSAGVKHILPSNTAVNINVQALHTDAKTWGPDSLIWRPDRWLKVSSPANQTHTTNETFIEPPPGAFVPWADGPRVCLGRKFSQVEFVAVMASLFGRHRVEPITSSGQGEEEGRKACLKMVNDSAITAITLQMRKPGSVALRWEKIQGV